MSHDPIAAARALALRAHAQQRYGDQPYPVHLAATVAILERHGLVDPELVAAAWLHDTIEDTAVTRDEVAAVAGEAVAAMVDAVSDGPGDSRTARKARPYQMIPVTPGAVLIKLADRIANVEASVGKRPRKLDMYRQEHPDFRRKLHDPTDHRAAGLWATLDSLLAP